MLKSNNDLSKFKNRENLKLGTHRISNYDELTGIETITNIPCASFSVETNCFRMSVTQSIDKFLEIIAFEAEKGININ